MIIKAVERRAKNRRAQSAELTRLTPFWRGKRTSRRVRRPMMNDPARGQGPGEIGDSVEEAEEGTGAMGGPEPEPPTD
jgi:hypothetical protein